MATQDISQLVVEVKSKGIQTAANQLDKLATASDKAEAAVKKLGTAVVGVNGTMTGGVAQAAALVAAMTTLTAVMERMSQTQTRAAATVRTNNEAMAEAHALARGLSGSLGALWVTYGNLAGMGAGIALGASLKGIVSVGKDVEQTLEQVRVLGGATTEEVAQMSAMISDLGKGVQGPREVAEAFQVLTLAGLNAKEAMQGVQAALNLAVAGGVSIEKSSETLVQVGSALGYTADGFDHVADVIAKTAAASMSSVDSISNAFKSAAAVGEVYGASLNDIALGLAAVANLGIQGTSAGTALKNFYKDLSASTQKVTGTLKDMHMSIADFRDSQGFMLPLVDVVTKLNQGLGTLEGKARQMAMVKLFSQQGAREGAELLKMVNTASTEIDQQATERLGKVTLYANKLLEMQGQIKEAAAFSTLASIAMAQTTSNQLKSVANTLQTTLSDAFKSVAPQIGEVARALKAAFGSDEFKNTLVSLATGVADFTKFLVENAKAIGMVAAAWAAWKVVEAAAGVVKLAQAFEVATVATRAFYVGLGPIGVAILGLAAAWAIYKANKDNALDNHAGAKNLDEYINNTMKAVQREAEIIEMRKNNATEADILRKQQTDADKDMAAQAVKAAEADLKQKRDYVNKLYSSMDDDTRRYAEEAKSRGLKNTGFTEVDTYVAALKDLDFAEQAHARQVKVVTDVEKKLQDLRQQNADAAQAKARKALEDRPTGTGELSTKVGSDADKYAAALAKFQGDIKAANQALTNYREQEDAAFKQGQIGKLQLIDEVANKEVATYKAVAEASKQQMLIAAKHVDKDGKADKTADVERFKDQMERANEEAAQAQKMRLANQAVTEREAQATITNLKVKALEEQGRYVDAVNLKWSADGRLALEQAQADLAKYGDKFPWLADLVKAYAQVRDDAMNSAQVKEDAAAFNAAIIATEGSLKGFKAATFGVSIDTMFETATEASKRFDEEITKAKAKRDALMVDAIASGFSSDAMAKYNDANKALAAAADKQKTMWEGVGQTITDSLTKAFGTAGTALGELYKSSIKFAENDKMNASDRIKNYGDMAQSASGFFDKQSKGYRALNGIAQVFHIAEMARTLARTAASIVAGAAKFFEQSGWGGFAGVAAMGAVMAGLGYAMSSGGGANDKLTSDYVQKNQGTGSVLGDATAKSESITKSIDTLKSNSDMMLPLTQSMLNSLQGIQAAMTGLANLAVRAGVGTSSLGLSTGSSGMKGLLGSLFGKSSTTLTDSGLSFGGNVSDLMKGSGFNQYAVTTTSSSSLFGLIKSSSNNTASQGVSAEMANQFALVFQGLNTALKGAAGALGSNSDAVGKAIEGVVLQTTKISLKDLKGQDLTNAINNVLSEAMDEIAKQVYPQMQDFQQVGEGYAQTVTRVASGIEQADAALKKVGISAINYLDIANKTGDVAYEIAQQSIALKEGASGVGQIMSQVTGAMSDVVSVYTSLVAARKQMQGMGLGSGLNVNTLNGAGDLKSLTSDLSTYYDKFFTATEKVNIQTRDVADQFNALGYDLPNTRGQLRQWIETAASVGDQLKVGQLLSLVDAFDKLQTSLEGLGQVTDPFSDAAVKVAKAAYDNAMSAVENAYTRLETSINKEKDRITVAKDALQKNVDAINNVLTSIGDAVKATAPTPSQSQAFEKAMQVVQSATAAVRNGGDISQISGLDDAIKTLSSNNSSGYANLLDFQRAQGRANSALRDLSEAGTQQVSLAQQQIDLYQKQLDNLDKQLETAKSQLDALKGIDDSVLSVADALANFGSALGVAQAAKSNYDAVVAGNLGGGASAAIESLYKNILGRASDEAGKAFWMDSLLNKGVSMSTITQDFYNSAEFKAKSGIPSFDVGTNNVPADMLAMVHKGERIIPAADNAELQRKLSESSGDTKDNTEDELKLADIAEIIQIGDSANVRKLNEMFRIFQRWEIDGMPATRNTDPTVTV